MVLIIYTKNRFIKEPEFVESEIIANNFELLLEKIIKYGATAHNRLVYAWLLLTQQL
jgi:hypothetical protein